MAHQSYGWIFWKNCSRKKQLISIHWKKRWIVSCYQLIPRHIHLIPSTRSSSKFLFIRFIKKWFFYVFYSFLCDKLLQYPFFVGYNTLHFSFIIFFIILLYKLEYNLPQVEERNTLCHTHTHTEAESEGEREDLFNFNGVSFNL